MRGIPTVLIDRSTLFREGLGNLLSKKGFYITASAANSDEIATEETQSNGSNLILVGATGDDHLLEESIRSLRLRFDGSQIVVLSDEYDAGQVYIAFKMSANGYLMKTISCSTLVKSLELVMLGESVFPSAVLARITEESDPGSESEDETFQETPPPAHAPRTLSAREMQILQCLVRGQSNKMIARSLDIVEATVKVHIKAILRKIHVQNRTQAAIWAVNRLEKPLPVIEPSTLLQAPNGIHLTP